MRVGGDRGRQGGEFTSYTGGSAVRERKLHAVPCSHTSELGNILQYMAIDRNAVTGIDLEYIVPPMCHTCFLTLLFLQTYTH